MKRMTAFIFSALLAAISASAQADVVTLLNGDRLTGAVTTIGGGQLLIDTAHLGSITVPVDQVAGVQKADPESFSTASGAQLTGVLATEEGRQVIRTDEGLEPILVSDLILTPPAPAYTWTTNLDFGYVLSKGNSETESGSLLLDSVYTRGKAEHRAFAHWNTEEAEEVTTRDTLDAGYNFRWYFREKWYSLVNFGYFQDELKDIDSRITVGAGVGYQFLKTEISSLSTELGISQIFEDLGGESENNPAVRWAVDYNRWLRPDQVDYFYGHEVLKILDSERGEIYKANTGIRIHLSDLWTAHGRVDLVHETKPPEDRHRTDIIYSVGVGVVF